MAKKFLSALLAVLMIVSMVPMTAMATDATTVADNWETPTLVMGVSKNITDTNAALGKVLGATVSESGSATNILWFAMNGLTSGAKYKLSMTNTKGEELLGKAYISYTDLPTDFTGGSKGKNYIYVSLNEAGKKDENKQIDSDVLNPGTYTVTLKEGAAESVVATETFTLTKTTENETTVWSGEQTQKADAGSIESELKVQGSPFAGKRASDIQSGTPKFNVTADGEDKWKVAVSGVTVKYISGWTEFHSTYSVQQHGYYLGISIPGVLCGNVISKMVLNGKDSEGKAVEKVYDTIAKLGASFTDYSSTYCDLVFYMGETAEDAKKAAPVVKLTYGNMKEQTYTFDFSGLAFPDETVKAEAVSGVLTDLGNKNTNDLQSGITIDSVDTENRIIKVSGTSYYVKDWTQFSNTEAMQKGNFVALKLTNKAGIPMQLYSPTQKEQTTGGVNKGWKAIDTDGIIVTRLQNLEADKYLGKIKVGKNDATKEGTEWTIDYTGVEMMDEITGTDLQVYAVEGVLPSPYHGKKGSDLQKNIEVTRTTVNGVPTFKFSGESNYIFDWTAFDGNDAKNDGNFLAMKLTAGTGYTVTIEGGALDSAQGDYIVILDGTKEYKNKVTVTKGQEKKEYVLDYSAVKRLPAKIKDVAVASPSPCPIKASYDGENIVLSGKASPLASNPNLFGDITLTVTYDSTPAKQEPITVKLTKVGEGLEAASTKAEIAGNTLSFDTSMLVIKNEDAAESTTGAPSADVSADIPEELQEAAKEISTTLAESSQTKIDDKILQKYADVLSNEATDKASMITDAAAVVAENEDKIPASLKEAVEAAAEDSTAVNTVVQTYAKIEVINVTGGETEGEVASFELSITPMVRTLVTTVGADKLNTIKAFDPNATDETVNKKANAIVVNDEPVPVDEPTTVTLALPDSFKADKAYVKHTKDDGTVYTDYETTIEAGTPRILTFVSTHGFSTFEISGEEFAPDLSDDASITSLTVGGQTLTPVDNAYTLTVPQGTIVTALELTIVAADGATVTVDGEEYEDGMTVDLTNPVTIVVTAEDGETTAEYTLTAVEDKPDVWKNPFTDVEEGNWVLTNGALQFVSENGLMNSVDASDPTKFGPNNTFSRGMLATILYRYEKEPTVTGTNRFPDVEANTWYTNAVIWADKEGIVTGYDNGNFGPNDPVTREQMALMLYRHAKKPAVTGSALSNPDASKVSTWAKDAMQWAVDNGIITGKPGNLLDPQGPASRAEAATMLMRYLSSK